MKTKIVLLSVLLSAGLVASASAAGRGNRGGSGNAGRGANNGVCDLSGPGQGTPLRDGSGRGVCGNPNGTGTPLRDGSGKASAPGKGPKDGSGNRADCPIVPKT
jgi:hypothetical protein